MKTRLFAMFSLAVLPAATCAEARKDLGTALNAADAACVLAHASFPDVPAIAQVCGIEQALAPSIEQYLKEGVKQGLVAPKGAAAKWAPDGGHASLAPLWGGRLYYLRPKLG